MYLYKLLPDPYTRFGWMGTTASDGRQINPNVAHKDHADSVGLIKLSDQYGTMGLPYNLEL